MKSPFFLTVGAALVSSSTAFTTPNTGISIARPSTSLSMAARPEDSQKGKTIAASALAAAYLFTSAVSSDAAFAMDSMNRASSYPDHSLYGATSTVIAARSGGRAGGRAAPRMAPPAASTTTKIYNTRTTVVQPPVVVGSPYGYGYGGGYYDPTPGIALNMGLSAVSAIGNGMREYSQTQEIARSRAELSAARDREADMAERIRALEQMQMQQKGGAPGQPPVVYYAPPPGLQQQVQLAPSQQ